MKKNRKSRNPLRVNPYKLLTLDQLTNEYRRLLEDGHSTEERLVASRDLCEVLHNRPENMRDEDAANTISNMIAGLQRHVGDQ